MRFINKWSFSCAKGLAEVLNENHQKRSAYYFSFQIVFGGIVKYGIMLSVSLLLGIFIPSLIVYVSFVALRKLAGGYHMDTYGKCLIVSIGLFVMAAFTAKFTYQYWNTVHILALIGMALVSGLYVLIRYAPRDTPNRPITDPQEIKKFKTLSLIYLLVWVGIISTLTVFGFRMYALASAFGVLLELFGVTPMGHRFFDMINYGINHKK